MNDKKNYPYIREATEADYADIHAIWMQDHIIQYMSFSKMSAEAFKPIYQKLANESTIYVMIDKIDDEEKVVAVQRLKFGSGHRAHVAGYYSLGVHQDYQGRGCATKFNMDFNEIVKNKRMQRVELTQSGGNKIAYHIIDKLAFKKEVHFNEWLYRGDMNLEERYVYLLIDPNVSEHIANINMAFLPMLPAYKPNTKYQIQQNDNQYECYDSDGKRIGVVCVEPGTSVLSHIAFVDISVEKTADTNVMADCLREISRQLCEKGFKKIEAFSYQDSAINVLQKCGFHYRGEKVASLKIGDQYYNEAGMDLSFFNIEDAKKLLKTLDLDDYKETKISSKLTECQKKINVQLEEKTFDHYMAIYCENLAFQMLRDTLGKYPHYTQDKAPWQNLIENLPAELQDCFTDYASALGLKFNTIPERFQASSFNVNQ